MNVKKFLRLAVIAPAVMAVIVALATTNFAQKAPKGVNGTTLAAYKTIDICLLPSGGWRISGEIAVWNEGAIDTENFTINDFIEYKVGPKWQLLALVFENYTPAFSDPGWFYQVITQWAGTLTGCNTFSIVHTGQNRVSWQFLLFQNLRNAIFNSYF